MLVRGIRRQLQILKNNQRRDKNGSGNGWPNQRC